MMYSTELVSLDKDIIQDMSEASNHYRRYITNRFLVDMVHEVNGGLCAHIIDQETSGLMKCGTGAPIADGKIEVIEEGVVFHPPRADEASFLLPSKSEMSPIGNHYATRTRSNIDNVLEREQMMMPYGDDDDKIIIVLGTQPQ